MRHIERLLHSARPEIPACNEHQRRLLRQIEQRAQSHAEGFLSRHPDIAVLAFSTSLALILYMFSLTLGTTTRRPQASEVPGLAPVACQSTKTTGRGPASLLSYLRMLIPDTQTADPATFQRVLAEAVKDRHAAQQIVSEQR